MSAAIASTHWPRPSTDGPAPEAAGADVRQWVWRRNCCLTPRQMAAAFAALSLASLGIAGTFAWLGYTAVLAFAGLEVAAVGLALLVHCRHVGDREVLRLEGRRLRVERTAAARVTRVDFPIEWLRVEQPGRPGALITLSSQGRSLQVGRDLRPHQRQQVAQEIRLALARARAVPPSAFSV